MRARDLRDRVWIAIGMLVAVASLGCTLQLAGARPRLGIANGTTLDVTLFVNGVRVAESRPGESSPTIETSTLPSLPWSVEVRTASGRLLTSMQVAEGQLWTTTRPDGGASSSGTFGRVDLSCGRLTIWAGEVQPSGPAPPPNAGQPGDCLP
jgi:hypothetical protein